MLRIYGTERRCLARKDGFGVEPTKPSLSLPLPTSCSFPTMRLSLLLHDEKD